MRRPARRHARDGTNATKVAPLATASLAIQYQDPIVTVEGIGMMTEFLARLFGSTPDLVTTVEDEICIDDIYAATWTMVGQFNGVP